MARFCAPTDLYGAIVCTRRGAIAPRNNHTEQNRAIEDKPPRAAYPLARQRPLVQVALTDPAASVESLRHARPSTWRPGGPATGRAWVSAYPSWPRSPARTGLPMEPCART